MASLLQEDIVGRCLANYDNPYPSASLQCLEVRLRRCGRELVAGRGHWASPRPLSARQILAFWVSWMRKFYTKDGVLRLAHDVLRKLGQWRRREDGVPSEEVRTPFEGCRPAPQRTPYCLPPHSTYLRDS